MRLSQNTNISNELMYHLENGLTLSENIFRIYSDKYFALINEVRDLYENNLIRLTEEDIWLVESDLGKKVLLEDGRQVWLDAPIYLNEEYEQEIEEIRQKLKLNDEYEIDMIKDYGSIKHFSITKNGITKVFIMGNIYDAAGGNEIVNRVMTDYYVVDGVNHFNKYIDLDFHYFIFMRGRTFITFEKDHKYFTTGLKSEEGKSRIRFDEDPVKLSDVFVEPKTDELIDEAIHRGKKVKLNSPFRTPRGPKKFSVYVKTPKGTIKKVSFGDPNLRIKNANKKRAKSFRARHKCDQKKDRTTAGYWSCNVGRFAKKLGLKSSSSW
jgi:hypothetical protein